MSLSPGKVRGLHTTANRQGIFTILALDHGTSFTQSMRPTAPETVTFNEAVALKANVLGELAPYASAVLLDPVYGLGPALTGALPGDVGLVVAVEDGDYADPGNQTGRLLEGWSVAKIKRLGASAVKIFFYYDPYNSETARMQEDLAAAVVADCRRYDLPLFAEPLSYNINPADRPQIVTETARRLSQLAPDVLKLEFPVDVYHQPDQTMWAAACQALTAACQGIPWVLLSAGVDFDTFAEQVRIACQSGASGYLAGRAIWKEAASLPDEAQAAHLRDVGIPRLQQLAEIATKAGRPWTEFYPDLKKQVKQGWYKTYEEL